MTGVECFLKQMTKKMFKDIKANVKTGVLSPLIVDTFAIKLRQIGYR